MFILKKKKILLIHPPFTFGKKPKFTIPPLGIMYIAAILKKNNIDVRFIDANAIGYTKEELMNKIYKIHPDIIGFSVTTPQIRDILLLIEEIPHVKICLGGPHVNSVQEEIFQFSNKIDYLFYNECEFSFLKFCQDYPLEEIDGMIYRTNGEIVKNKPSPHIKDLDSLPFPDLSMVNLSNYHSPYTTNYPMAAMICSRGCPFQCNFCDAFSTHGRILRKRSPQNIVDEIEYNMKKFGIKYIAVKDSSFTTDKKWAHSVCEEIINRNLKISWNCNARVDCINEELLKQMKIAGCHMIGYGVESGSDEVLRLMNKGITVEQIKEAFRITHNIGIKTYAFFMIGNIGETKKTIRMTVDLAKELNPNLATFAVTTPYPNTALYRYAVENKLIDKYWYMKSTQAKYLGPATMSTGMKIELSLENITKHVYKEFFFRPKYIVTYIKNIENLNMFKDAIKGFFEIFRYK